MRARCAPQVTDMMNSALIGPLMSPGVALMRRASVSAPARTARHPPPCSRWAARAALVGGPAAAQPAGARPGWHTSPWRSPRAGERRTTAYQGDRLRAQYAVRCARCTMPDMPVGGRLLGRRRAALAGDELGAISGSARRLAGRMSEIVADIRGDSAVVAQTGTSSPATARPSRSARRAQAASLGQTSASVHGSVRRCSATRRVRPGPMRWPNACASVAAAGSRAVRGALDAEIRPAPTACADRRRDEASTDQRAGPQRRGRSSARRRARALASRSWPPRCAARAAPRRPADRAAQSASVSSVALEPRRPGAP